MRITPATNGPAYIGIVEILHLGIWGRIAEVEAGMWTDQDATTVCTELGYVAGIGFTVSVCRHLQNRWQKQRTKMQKKKNKRKK